MFLDTCFLFLLITYPNENTGRCKLFYGLKLTISFSLLSCLFFKKSYIPLWSACRNEPAKVIQETRSELCNMVISK